MIQIKRFIFNPFQENTYILSDETGECIIVDAGCYSEEEKTGLTEYIQSKQLKPVKLVNTHCHVDHLLGNHYIYEKYKPMVQAHKDDSKLLTDAKTHGLVFGFEVEEPPLINEFLDQGDEVKFGKSVLKVLHVPGHSPGSIALYHEQQKFVIAGDVLFKDSIGRTDLPGGNYDILRKSIFTKLMTLPPETTVLPGHGPSTTIHEEALSNPFLV